MYPLPVALVWESKVAEEFIQQAELEARLGLPVAPFMQGLDEPCVRYKGHLGFLDFVMFPLWRGLADLYPTLDACIDQLQENRQHFATLLAKESEKKAAREDAECEQAAADSCRVEAGAEPATTGDHTRDEVPVTSQADHSSNDADEPDAESQEC